MSDVRFVLKSDCSMEDFKMLSPKLLVMFATVLEFADQRKLPVKITSIITDRVNVQAKSKTHETGRALDISIDGWRDDDIMDLGVLLVNKHKDIAAISSKDLKPRPLVWHDVGHGDHMHLQVRP